MLLGAVLEPAGVLDLHGGLGSSFSVTSPALPWARKVCCVCFAFSLCYQLLCLEETFLRSPPSGGSPGGFLALCFLRSMLGCLCFLHV